MLRLDNLIDNSVHSNVTETPEYKKQSGEEKTYNNQNADQCIKLTQIRIPCSSTQRTE